MRRALRPNPARAQVSQPIMLPPPIGGWNAREDLPSMAPNDAIRLDNWIPDTGGVRTRKGFREHATGLSGTFVETLMEYASPVGAPVLFGATPTSIYNVTAAGTAGLSLTGLTNGRWSYTMFSAGSGIDVLYICNGVDAARYYSAGAWTNSAFTGIATTQLDYVTTHGTRLWFIEKGSASVWYGPVGSVSGALTQFPVQAQLKLGGKLVAIGSWSRDGGEGMDDFFVMVSSKGEVLVYQGTDPASISTWRKVGLYRIAEPIGRRCLHKAGGDLAVLTSQGLISLQQALGLNVSGSFSAAVTDKIVGAFRSAYAAYKDKHGWQVQDYPKGNLLIVNVPISERSKAHQYVANIRTGAWARFTDINANCWALLGDTLYFGGSDGKVHKWDVGYDDNGATITATVQTSFSNYGGGGLKRWTQVQPMLVGPASYSPQVYVKTDYDTSATSMVVSPGVDLGSSWNASNWNTAKWSLGPAPAMHWQTVAALGVTGSIAFAVQGKSPLVYNGSQVLFEPGGLF